MENDRKMNPPSFLLPRPSFEKTPQMVAAFDHLIQATAVGDWVDYSLPYPKWQFLTYLCEANPFVLHGSQNLEIPRVEPQQARDIRAFSSQRAIYATTDGIWVQYFAILDRLKYPEMSLFNSCLQARDFSGLWSEPLYFFSITNAVFLQKPWCTGAVYILPREHFVQEAAQSIQGTEIVFPHWTGSQPAQPIARLLVGPQDFPFLAQIHGHNDARLMELAAENPEGFPWLEALES
jgi:hypothetical protein